MRPLGSKPLSAPKSPLTHLSDPPAHQQMFLTPALNTYPTPTQPLLLRGHPPPPGPPGVFLTPLPSLTPPPPHTRPRRHLSHLIAQLDTHLMRHASRHTHRSNTARLRDTNLCRRSQPDRQAQTHMAVNWSVAQRQQDKDKTARQPGHRDNRRHTHPGWSGFPGWVGACPACSPCTLPPTQIPVFKTSTLF